MLPVTQTLIDRLHRPDSTVRRFVVAQTVVKNADGSLQQSIRQKRDDWGLADGAAAGPPPTLANFALLENGDVRLAGTGSTIVTKAGPPNAYITDLNRLAPFSVISIAWNGSETSDLEIKRVKIHLNPRVNGAQTRQVVKWRLEMYALTKEVSFKPNNLLEVVRLGDAIDVDVANDVEGLVTFDFSAGRIIARPKPKFVYPLQGVTQGSFTPNFPHPTTFLVVTALDANGNGAANAGLGYDSGTPSVTTAGTTLSSRTLLSSNSLDYADGGIGSGCPIVTIDTETYTTQTISFTSNLLNLGGAPSGDVQLVGRGMTPTGTSITFQVRNDADSGWVTYTDGQWMIADLGLTPTQTRKFQAILTTNAASNLTPTLTGLGMEAFTEVNFLRQTRITGGAWAIDPQTLRGEIPEVVLTFIRDGERDYLDAITELLANNDIGNIRFRLYWGDSSMARKDWLHRDDILIDGSHPKGASIQLKCLTPLCLLRDLVPRFKPGANYAPDGDQSVGAWTTDAGGNTNLYQRLDEAVFDDTDYVRSELTPASSAYELTLPTPADPVGRRHLVDYRFRKDVTGGEQIDLTVELRQGSTVIASQAHSNIETDAASSATPFSFALTDAQVALITNYVDLRIRFTANKVSGTGARRAVVTWARFRTAGKQDPVSYNTTLKGVYDGLVSSDLGIDARYRGPGVEDIASTNQVAKTIYQTGDANNKPLGKSELDNIAFIAGGGIISSAGRITFRDMFTTKPAVALFPSSEISLDEAGPGYEERIPELFVKWRWNQAKGDFDRQEYIAHAGALLKLGKARLDPARWVDDETSKWLSNEGLDSNQLSLAARVGIRQVQALGPGLMLWPFVANYPHPWLEPGDVISIQTDKFVARDPNVARALKGALWATAVIQSADVDGQHFTAWVRNYSDILVDTSGLPGTGGGDRLGLWTGLPRITSPKVLVDEGGNAWAIITCYAATSVRVASSTSGMPTDATARAAALQALDANGQLTTASLLALTPGQTVYVKIFAYEKADGSGLESPAATATVPFGTRQRGHAWSDSQYALRATETDGSTKQSTAHNPQGSILPISAGSVAGILAYAVGGTSTTNGHMPMGFRLVSDTVVARPDGSTFTMKGNLFTDGNQNPAGSLSQVAGGAFGARTRFVKIAYVKDGMIYPRNDLSSIAISANNLLRVTRTSDATKEAGYDGWVVCVGLTHNNEVVNRADGGSTGVGGTLGATMTALIPFGTTVWTEDATNGATTSFGSGTPVSPSGGPTDNYVIAIELSQSTAYFFYCGYDQSVGNQGGNLRFTPYGGSVAYRTAQNTTDAGAANGDKLYGLSFQAAGGASGISTPVAGSSSSGNTFVPRYA